MIAGSIVMSESPPQQLKFWRKKFGVKQADLAKRMAITPSVLSDYEKGRRPSPGVNFIRRYLVALYGLSRGDQRHPEQQQEQPQHQVQAAAPIPDAAVHINPTS
jgi:putative transcriptional regulator